MKEHLAAEDWEPYLSSMRDGETRRVPHFCGEGSPLKITKGIVSTAYCFRCGLHGRHEETLSLQQRLALQAQENAADAQLAGSIQLPICSTRDMASYPSELKLWLYRMGISQPHADMLGLYYTEPSHRVVLPILNDRREVIFWSARSQTRQPKWMSPPVPKNGLVAVFGKGKGDKIVLNEDPLSAYKVGLVNEAWCLFGTKLHDRVINRILNDGRRVVTWLDDDRGRRNGSNPGQDAARSMRSRLRALGETVLNITSDRDPKFLSRQEIQEKLNGP